MEKVVKAYPCFSHETFWSNSGSPFFTSPTKISSFEANENAEMMLSINIYAINIYILKKILDQTYRWNMDETKLVIYIFEFYFQDGPQQLEDTNRT